MAPSKINIKDRFTDGEIDLSMSDIEEVPVKDIASLKNAYSLDISNNRIQSLPANFSSLVNIIKLDLSKNELKELPDNFGNLVKLRHLDLYQNQIQHLPLSFCNLKDLKWLDLKDNPLVPTVAKIAGPCLDTKQCQKCAKDVVNFFVKLQEQVKNELEARNQQRKKQLEINNIKKQEEKKNKKKEKKSKQQNKNEDIPLIKNKNHKTAVEVKGNNVKNIKTKPSFLKTLFFTFLISTSILFVLTSIKLKQTEKFEIAVRTLYERFVLVAPENLLPYCKDLAKSVGYMHEKTGNITIEVIKTIQDQTWCCLFKDFVASLSEKIHEFYKSLIK
ncbi:unnamed protein product [Brassicogethes aeneus]|uniref:Leucine-rich repeat-containing protein 59 n=1 Tax=Brassicogethes aeneus TaxID=1431903 RepID=A0A9P0ATA7_BRAAE|nr:unnamed protein product [Brassicogethes aeneus]